MTYDINEEMPEYLINLPADPDSFFELSDRHAAGIVLPDLDYESQFIAIQQLLQVHTEYSELHTQRIHEIEEFAKQTSGLRNEIAVNEWVDRLHDSVFQDAAHSMAAVSMLAPFLESILEQAFQGVRLKFHKIQGKHSRWSDSKRDEWDPHFVWNKGRRSKNIVTGTMQLLEATEMLKFQPMISVLLLKVFLNIGIRCSIVVLSGLSAKETSSQNEWRSGRVIGSYGPNEEASLGFAT